MKFELASVALGIAATYYAVQAPAITRAQAPAPSIENHLMPTVPGEVRTTNAGEICGAGTSHLRNWSRERDNRILVRDRLPPGKHPTVEIDHLIPLGIGGADTDLNLWAQPRGGDWGAEAKDRLEWRMRDMICKQHYDPAPLQSAIAADWIAAYKRYMP
jgi:hypothetical protein